MNPYHDQMMPQWPSHMPYIPGRLEPQFFVSTVRPLVDYGLAEARVTSDRHAMTEVALIAYLMGMGYDCNTVYRMVESWEMDESFPGE